MSAPTGYPELMVDIETMGAAPHGAVLAIGAVPFSLHPEKMELAPREQWMNARITLDCNMREGRKVDADTIEWWLSQSKEAQDALLAEERYNNLDALREDFIQLVERNRCKHIWAKPPQFDLVILRDLFGPIWPFHWRDERDLRTALAVAKREQWTDVLEVHPTHEGMKHDALYDAVYQALQTLNFHERCATPR